MQYIIGKAFSRPFRRCIKNPKIRKILVGKPKKHTCNRLMTAGQGGKKELQWENDCNSFSQCFLLVFQRVCFFVTTFQKPGNSGSLNFGSSTNVRRKNNKFLHGLQ